MENDSAREFLALPPKAANEKIVEASRWINENDPYGLDEHSVEFAECLLSDGIFEKFKTMDEDQRYVFSRLWDEGVRVRDAHTITALIEGSAPIPLSLPKGTAFGIFDQVYRRAFEGYKRDMGSEAFKKSIHEYCTRFTLSGEDPYIPFVAFVLKDELGEARVMKVLDDISESSSISANEFYAVLKSDLDLDNTPLSWAVNFVR